MKAFIIGLVVVIVIGVGGYLIFHKSPGKTATTPTSSNGSPAQPQSSTTNNIPQNGGGDHDGDNSGGPDDGDGPL
jgi:hypothetical protein